MSNHAFTHLPTYALTRLPTLPPAKFRFDTLRHNIPHLEISIRTHNKRIRLTGPHTLQPANPLRRPVENRMILQFDLDFHRLGHLDVMRNGLNVLLQPIRRNPI